MPSFPDLAGDEFVGAGSSYEGGDVSGKKPFPFGGLSDQAWCNTKFYVRCTYAFLILGLLIILTDYITKIAETKGIPRPSIMGSSITGRWYWQGDSTKVVDITKVDKTASEPEHWAIKAVDADKWINANDVLTIEAYVIIEGGGKSMYRYGRRGGADGKSWPTYFSTIFARQNSLNYQGTGIFTR